MIISNDTFDDLLTLAKEKDIYLSGDIIKYVNTDNDLYNNYLNNCLIKHKKESKERYLVSQKVLIQNAELLASDREMNEILLLLKDEKDKLKIEQNKTKKILLLTEKGKKSVEEELEYIQTKKKLDILGTGLKWLLLFLGLIIIASTSIYLMYLYKDLSTEIISNQVFTIFNSFLVGALSIIGSTLGVKHVMETNNEKKY